MLIEDQDQKLLSDTRAALTEALRDGNSSKALDFCRVYVALRQVIRDDAHMRFVHQESSTPKDA